MLSLSRLLVSFSQLNGEIKRNDLLRENQKQFLLGFDNLINDSPKMAAKVVKFLANTIQGYLFTHTFFYDRQSSEYITHRVWHSILPKDDSESKKETLEVNIKDTPVISCIWSYKRVFDDLGFIGKIYNNPFDGVGNENNISANLLLPLNFVIVNSGNHSTNSAIINDEGTLKINNVIQMDPVLEKYYFDGVHYRECESEEKIRDDYLCQKSRPILYEFGLLFEIARVIQRTSTKFDKRPLF